MTHVGRQHTPAGLDNVASASASCSSCMLWAILLLQVTLWFRLTALQSNVLIVSPWQQACQHIFVFGQAGKSADVIAEN